MNKYCKFCGAVKEVTLQNEVPGKEDTYFFECGKGHISEFYLSKQMKQLLEEKEEFSEQ